MTGCEVGDVILVPFPFTDQMDTKKRPAVVVSSAAYHRARIDLIVVPTTSQIRSSTAFGEVLVPDQKTAGLIKPGVIKPVITTIERYKATYGLRSPVLGLTWGRFSRDSEETWSLSRTAQSRTCNTTLARCRQNGVDRSVLAKPQSIAQSYSSTSES